MGPYSYQNGGDWCWFGGRMIQQLIRHGFVREAFQELKPMVHRVIQHGDFYEWWSLDNQPRGSARFRGSAGVLGRAIELLLEWAGKIEANGGDDGTPKVPDAYWPCFRGPDRTGISNSDFPIHFGPRSNVVWNVTIPGGRSSPCVWGNRLFLTAFADGRLLTLCIDTHDGRELWRRELSPGAIEQGARLGSPATATPVTDGRHVFVYFGAFGLAAYDFEGRVAWSKPLPIPVTQHGAGTSPVLAGEALILNCDQDVGSYLLALEKDTGSQIWKRDRSAFRRGFSTPLPYPFDHPEQLIVAGTLRLTSYNLLDGSER